MEDTRPERLKVNDWDRHRERILRNRGRYCRFCGLAERAHQERFDCGLHVHHIIPRYEGGSDHPDNLMVVCNRCHRVLEAATEHVIDMCGKRQREMKNNLPARNHLGAAVTDLTKAIESYPGDTSDIRELQDTLIEWLNDDVYKIEDND